jgi:two-component system, sensor histidine kinase and response regulator
MMNDLDRQLAVQSFLETAGYKVSVSKSAASEPPALVVLDAFEGRRPVPEHGASATLALVPARETDTQAQARALGVDDCAAWPLGRAEFLCRVRALLRWKVDPAADSGRLLRLQMDEIMQLQRQREQTLALLVHDMKNPLSGVISNVEYLRTGISDLTKHDPELPGCADDILQGARRLYRMVQSLLDVNQSEDGLLSLDPQPIEVRSLLETAHATCRARLRDKDIELSVSYPEHSLVLSVDHDMMVRLLANLLDNAITATPHGGKIGLSANEHAHTIELRVSDQGPSLPAAERARLSQPEPALPLRNTRVRRGLGLRSCRVLAEAHGGKLSLEEHAPRGATVCVQLPLNRHA